MLHSIRRIRDGHVERWKYRSIAQPGAGCGCLALVAMNVAAVLRPALSPRCRRVVAALSFPLPSAVEKFPHAP
jgi:hypothetical protein